MDLPVFGGDIQALDFIKANAFPYLNLLAADIVGLEDLPDSNVYLANFILVGTLAAHHPRGSIFILCIGRYRGKTLATAIGIIEQVTE